MTTLAPTPAAHSQSMPRQNWLRRAEAWLDARGRGAWIAAMVLGFVLFWPVGLALVLYMTVANKWACSGRGGRMTMQSASSMGSSGNTAFDAYKAETLRRLEEEQGSFEAFLERLRAAKDKAEFDQFMDERAKDAADSDARHADGTDAGDDDTDAK